MLPASVALITSVCTISPLTRTVAIQGPSFRVGNSTCLGMARENDLREQFRLFSNKIADRTGSPAGFGLAVLAVVIWACTGPYFHYSDTWQLVINTATSVITLLMVFLIQNTQNRDAKAMQLKLNELIRAVSTARNIMLDLENCTEEELAEIREEFATIRTKVVEKRQKAS